MPAPTTTQACGFCARPFDVGPVTYRLAATRTDAYRWTVDDRGRVRRRLSPLSWAPARRG